MKKYLRGFTLLELLVVIGIIALLVSLGVGAYGSAQKRARDAKRRADMEAIRGALEQYYQDNNSSYPTNCVTGVSGYLQQGWPTDPISLSNYGSNGCSAASYCACATLEVPGTGNSGANCAWTNGGDYYCIKNQQ